MEKKKIITILSVFVLVCVVTTLFFNKTIEDKETREQYIYTFNIDTVSRDYVEFAACPGQDKLIDNYCTHSFDYLRGIHVREFDGNKWNSIFERHLNYTCYDSSLLLDNNNDLYVFWTELLNGSNTTMMKKLGEDKIHNFSTIGYPHEDAVALCDSSNNIHVMFYGKLENDYDIRHIIYDGEKWSKITNVTNGDFDQFYLSACIDPYDRIHCVWQSKYGIQYSLYDDGNWTHPQHFRSGSNQTGVDIIYKDGPIVAWMDNFGIRYWINETTYTLPTNYINGYPSLSIHNDDIYMYFPGTIKDCDCDFPSEMYLKRSINFGPVEVLPPHDIFMVNSFEDKAIYYNITSESIEYYNGEIITVAE